MTERRPGGERAPAGLGRLSGKVTIVSGAGSMGSGIGNGRAIAILFAREGARVALLDHRLEAAAETQQAIALDCGDHYRSVAIECDVTKPKECQTAVQRVVELWARLDVLVNNVGIVGPRGSAVDTELEDWDLALRTNVTSMMLLTKYAVPQMVETGGGSIINLSSIMGLRGGGVSLLYGTSKGAVINMTRTMAFQHGPQGIRVNCIAPGNVYTPLAQSEGLTEEGRDARRQRSLLGTEGTAWDVGHAAVFLASDEARWITGVVLPVDGGYLAAEPRPRR